MFGLVSENNYLGSQTSVVGKALQWAFLAALVYAILLSVSMVGSGFKWASGGTEGAKKLFEFATNPFLGLLIGTLATALVQSSSTVTSVIVGLVAGGLPVATAIPMVMGANIGTTITNTLVSLGHARHPEEFKRAFSAATVHDFFNLLAVFIFLPLELMFGVLEKSSAAMAAFLVGGSSMSMSGFNFIKPITKPVISGVKGFVAGFPDPFGGVALVVLGILIIFFAITAMGKVMKVLMVGRAKRILQAAIGRGPISGIFSGTAVTILVQSSSTTTSLAVPLAGNGLISTREMYPFTLGANIGTCITALLASTAISGTFAIFALQIAFVHLFYNISAVLLIFGLPLLRDWPLLASEKIALLAVRRKSLALAYILFVFFLLPGAMLGLTEVM